MPPASAPDPDEEVPVLVTDEGFVSEEETSSHEPVPANTDGLVQSGQPAPNAPPAPPVAAELPVAAEPVEADPAMAQPEAVIPLEGVLVSRKGKKVVIEVDHPDPPPAGEKAVLYKWFEKQIGPFASSGWLGIADVTITKVHEGKLTLKITEELSKIVVDGKKVNHFKKGAKVKLETD